MLYLYFNLVAFVDVKSRTVEEGKVLFLNTREKSKIADSLQCCLNFE